MARGNGWGRDRWVLPYFTRYRRVLALALGLGVLAAVLACLLMFVSGWVIGAAARMPETIFALMMPIALVQVLGIGKPVVSYVERLESHDWVFRMTSDLRRRLFLAFAQLTGVKAKPGDVSYGEGAADAVPGAGDALALLNDDVAHVQNLYIRCIFPLVVAWIATFLFAIALGAVDALFAGWMLLELLVCAAVLPAASLAAGAAARTRRKRGVAGLYRELADAVLGAADVVFAGRVDDAMARFRTRAGEVARDDHRLASINRLTSVIVRAVLALAAAGLVVWAARAFSAQGDVAIAAILCFFPLAEVIAPSAEAAAQLPEHREAVRRLNGLDEGTGATADVGSTTGAGAGSAAAVGEDVATGSDDAPAVVPPCRQAPAAMSAANPNVPVLRFDHVSFAYPDAPRPALDDLSFDLAPGQKMALLGRSGAGKSTLLSLVRGVIEPDTGVIELLGGPHLGPEAVTRLVGVIQQDPRVFDTTVLDNLRIARADATEDQAREALERVGLWQRVQRFDRGLMSVVGEEGRTLSGGERHRLALARILLADTPLVVLDEPFAGLDPATERAVLGALFDALADRTILMVTHHLQGVEHMDRVAFLEGGRFVLDGAPTELERSSERYRRLLAADRGLAWG